MTFDFFMTEVLGWIGMVGFALCHLLLSMKILRVTIFYQILQILSAIALGASAYWSGFYPSFGLEIFWIGVSVAAIVTYIAQKKSVPAA